jgi:hypothetical protein
MFAGQRNRNEAFIDRMCGAKHFALLGRSCQACPANAVCNEFFPFPLPAPGFFEETPQRFVRCVPVAACSTRPIAALSAAVGPGKLSLTSYLSALKTSPSVTNGSSPEESSVDTRTRTVEYTYGGSSVSFLMDIATQNEILLQYYNASSVEELPADCASGYTGPKCSQCMPEHYRRDSTCVPCPKAAYMLMVAFFAALVLLLVLAFLGRRKNINMTALSLGIDFLQIVSIFTSFGFLWPNELNDLFNAASVASLNDQLLAPECTVHSWSVQRKWFAVQVLPGCFIVLLAALVTMNACWKWLQAWRHAKKGRTTPVPRSHLDRLVNVAYGFCITAIYTLYFSVVKGALSIFNCVENQSGVRVLVAYPSEQCDVVRIPCVCCLLLPLFVSPCAGRCRGFSLSSRLGEHRHCFDRTQSRR